MNYKHFSFGGLEGYDVPYTFGRWALHFVVLSFF